MEYEKLTTEELLRIVEETEMIDPHTNPEVVADYNNGRVVQKILNIMDIEGISQNELAKKIGRSKQYVSRILHEKQNFTIGSLAVFSSALNCELHVDINPKEQKPKNNKSPQSNEEFWEHVSKILPEGTDPSYHETFRSAIHCVKDVGKDFQEIDVIHKGKHESEYKIS